MAKETLTTVFGHIISVSGSGIVCGMVREGTVYEANDILSIGPVVGDMVLADYLPSSRQWIIVAIVPP
jgi:hypothetical protein